jgi:hypothetical protein
VVAVFHDQHVGFVSREKKGSSENKDVDEEGRSNIHNGSNFVSAIAPRVKLYSRPTAVLEARSKVSPFKDEHIHFVAQLDEAVLVKTYS